MAKGNKTQMNNLNEDVQFLIFEYLKLGDLLAIAETNQRFAILAENIFTRKYSMKFIELNDIDSTSDIIARENFDDVSINNS